MTHPRKIASPPAGLVVSNLTVGHKAEAQQHWAFLHYRLAAGAAAVSGVQAIPVPELAALHLEPGETLTLRYDLRPTLSSDAAASITLKTRDITECQAGKTTADRTAARLAALSMCLPGFHLHPTNKVSVWPEAMLAPGYSALSLAPEQDWADDADVASLRTRQPTTPLIHLPVLAPWAIRVDRLLEALIDGSRAASLSVELARVSFRRREVSGARLTPPYCRWSMRYRNRA